MKVVVLYRPNSEFSRRVEEFVRDLQVRQIVEERQLQVLSYDSREGAATASLYDVMSQPSVLILNDDGSYIKSWEGSEMPLLSEVAGYVFSYQ